MVWRDVPLLAAMALCLSVDPAPTAPIPQSVPPAAQATAPWPPPGIERAGKGVEYPKLVKEFKPNYTKSAMDLGLSGTVEMEAVVTAEGRVSDVRVVRSLDKEHGLDEEAVKALKKWEFKPALKDGVAVPVLVSIEMSFDVRKK